VEQLIAEYIRTEDQTADILTIPLPQEKHQRHVTEMGQVPV